MAPLDPTLQAASLALVHFLWQGTLIALVAFAALRVARTPNARYLIGVASLAAMLLAPAATSIWIAGRIASTHTSAEARSVSKRTDTYVGATSPDLAPRLDKHAASGDAAALAQRPRPWAATEAAVLIVWACGVLVLSGRLAGGWIVARRLAGRAIVPARPEIAVLARRVAGRLALDRAVRVFESTAIAVPMMVGWLKPVVLLPVAALGGLTPTQLEALIAHELAHVRRHDYLVNLLQSAVETLLFYHPAVWWISRQVRTEREHCCDDLAVTVCDRLVYVSALADLAALSTLAPRPLALAASDGSLLARVQRLLGGPREPRSSSAFWAVLLASFVVVIGGTQIGPWAPRAVDAAALPQTPAAAVVASFGEQTPATPSTTVSPAAVATPVTTLGAIASSDAMPTAGATAVAIAAPQTSATPEIASTDALIVAKAKLAKSLEELASQDPQLGGQALQERLAAIQDSLRKLEEPIAKRKLTEAETADRQKVEALLAEIKQTVDERANSKAALRASVDQNKVKAIEAETTKSLVEAKMALENRQAAEGRAAFKSADAHGSSGVISWSEDGQHASVRWNGLFKISDDDRDIAWVEPGKTVDVSDGGLVGGTGVEITAGADGRVIRTYRRNGVSSDFDADARAYLATALAQLIANTGFAADMRVARLLRTGGVDAVLKEIDTLKNDSARHEYYVELIHQANLPAADLARIGKKASETIKSSSDLTAVIVDGAKHANGNDEALRALMAVTPKIVDDHDRDRARIALLEASPKTKTFAERAQVVTNAKRSAEERADSDALDAFKAQLKQNGLTDRTAPDVFKTVSALPTDTDRANGLIEVLQGRTLTPVQRKLYVATAESIRSDTDQNRALAALVRAEGGR